MYQCIECRHHLTEIINSHTRTVHRCPNCDEICDSYYECDEIQKWIDVILLRRRAWVHILFNEDDLVTIICCAVLCCGLEAFIVRSKNVLLAHSPNLPKGEDISGISHLQLVRNIKSPYFSLMEYASTLPFLIASAIEEYILLTVAAAWIGNTIGRAYAKPLSRWVLVVALANASKAGYTFFLIWMTPPFLLSIIDLVFYLWLFRGFLTLFPQQSSFIPLTCVAVCALTRGLFRFASGWAPQISPP